MSSSKLKLAATVAGIAMALLGTTAQASHFRGAAMVSSVSATGLLTMNATSFWRPSGASVITEGGGVSTSQGFMSQVGLSVNDTSDTRFTKVSQTFTLQLTTAGLTTLSTSSCCRVGGIANASEASWAMNSAIFWNGTTANTPILFNFSNVQPEVLRGVAYSGNLGAVSGSGLTLTYDQVLNQNINSQPLGFSVNSTTGALTIDAASTLAGYSDNPSGNIGADRAFSGNIKASDGSFVEFDWLFDGVNSLSNLAPTVNDQIINALVGDTVATTVTAADDGLPTGVLTWNDIGLLGSAGTCSNAPTFNTATQSFSWNTSGCAIGQYIYQVQASDGQKTDFGTITINVGPRGGGNQVPEPGMLSLLGFGALGLVAASRRRKQK